MADSHRSIATIRVVVADDHAWVREGFRGGLHRPPEMIVAALAADEEELLRVVREARPDVVLLDHALGKNNGLEIATRLPPCCPMARVVLITAWEDAGTFNRAQQAGLGGFLLKKANDELLRQAVIEVAAGRRFFQDHYPQPPAIRTRRRWDQLTSNEWAVIRALVATGSPKVAAGRLGSGYSPKSVSNHLQSIYGKLAQSGFRTVIELYRAEGVKHDPART